MGFHLRLAAFTTLLLALPPASGPADAGADDSSSPRITIDADSPAWTQRIEWGVDRFRQADLVLPSVTITVHDVAAGKARCGGATGRFRAIPQPEVDLCASSEPDSRTARLITLHELAHAWAETQLGAEDKEAFLRLRALDTWVDPDVAPHEWGAEHAAEVVSWGLMDEPANIIRIYDAEPAQLATAFDLLVDQPPLWAADR